MKDHLKKALTRSLALAAVVSLSAGAFPSLVRANPPITMPCIMDYDNGCYCAAIMTCVGDCYSTLPGTGCWHVGGPAH